jgi:hypothetical protein
MRLARHVARMGRKGIHITEFRRESQKDDSVNNLSNRIENFIVYLYKSRILLEIGVRFNSVLNSLKLKLSKIDVSLPTTTSNYSRGAMHFLLLAVSSLTYPSFLKMEAVLSSETSPNF